jgi:ketosteroid isomerase-like protein
MTLTDDELAIRSLVGRMALLSDEGAAEDYALVYSSDAVWTMAGRTQTGIGEIVAAARGRREQGTGGPGSHNRHLVVPLQVDVTGDTALAVSYFLFLADTAAAPTVRSFGVYRDSFARVDGEWRIRRRTIDAG